MYKYFLLFVMFVFMTSFKDGISIEDRLVSLESKVSSLEKENKDLKDRVLPLEKYININDKNEVDVENKTNIKNDNKTNVYRSTYSDNRCQATTKKGERCKRNAEPGSKYCWQHNK